MTDCSVWRFRSLVPSIGGCRAQNEPGHGGLSTNEIFILWLKFDSLSHFVPHGSKVYPGTALVCPGLQPPMVPRLPDLFNARAREEAEGEPGI